MSTSRPAKGPRPASRCSNQAEALVPNASKQSNPVKWRGTRILSRIASSFELLMLLETYASIPLDDGGKITDLDYKMAPWIPPLSLFPSLKATAVSLTIDPSRHKWLLPKEIIPQEDGSAAS